MYHKILVPLDGSKLAELALPHMEQVAKGCSIPRIVLVTVTEPIRVSTPETDRIEQTPTRYQKPVIYYGNFSTGMGGVIVPDVIRDLPMRIGKMAKTGYDYLTHIAKELDKKGLEVSIAVLTGNIVEEITYFAEQENIDLIIMARRDRTSLKRWDVANAAEKISRKTSIPILLVKPPSDFRETKPVRKGRAL